MDENPIVRGKKFGPYHGENDPTIKFAELANYPDSQAKITQIIKENNTFVKMFAAFKKISQPGGLVHDMAPSSQEKAQELLHTILVVAYTHRFLGLITREYEAPTDTDRPRKKVM